MRKYSLLIVCLILANLVFGQLKITQTGRLEIDAQNGKWKTGTTCIKINSNSTNLESINTNLGLLNTNVTQNNWIRMSFLTKRADNFEEDFVGFATQFKNRTVANRAADFHIATLNKGHFASRFIIYSNPNDVNNVKFLFNTGNSGGGRGIWIDDLGSGESTIRPTGGNWGYLGTQTNYWYKLYVAYAYYNSHASVTSDIRKKKDVRNIEQNTIAKLSLLRGVKYKMKDDFILNQEKENIIETEKDKKRPDFDREIEKKELVERLKEKQQVLNQEHYGFIAQELQKVYPDIVEYNKENDSYAVKYTALIPIIVEGIKEQQNMINKQKRRIDELERILKNSSSSTKNNNDKENDKLTKQSELFQNSPNPFSENTEISYFLSENETNAMLCIYDLNGTQIKSYIINHNGNGTQIISGVELKPGIYIYSLIASGKLIDSKRMVITEK